MKVKLHVPETVTPDNLSLSGKWIPLTVDFDDHHVIGYAKVGFDAGGELIAELDAEASLVVSKQPDEPVFRDLSVGFIRQPVKP